MKLIESQGNWYWVNPQFPDNPLSPIFFDSPPALQWRARVGSENLGPYVREHAAELGCDMVLISDTEMFDRGVPSICYGLRGLAYMQVDIRGTKGDLH